MSRVEYSCQSDERKMLGVFLITIALLSFTTLYILDCAGFVIFILLVAGVLVLGLPAHKNLQRLEGKSVLITGCDTGFGHELAKRLCAGGATVFAGCLLVDGDGARKLRDLNNDKLHVLQLDVTCDDQVHMAVNDVREKSGELHAVVNNAGINCFGDADIVSVEEFIRVGDINLYGAVRVTKSCLPLLKQTKGRVINVTSVKGILAFPFCSHYNAAKFGLEAFSDCLRLEMKRFGVRVSIIEPCNFGGITNALQGVEKELNRVWNSMSPDQQEEYGREYIDEMIAAYKKGALTTYPNMDPVLDAMEESVRAERPQYRYLVSGSCKSYDKYRWLALLRPYIPTPLLDEYILKLVNLPIPAVLKR